MDIQIIMAVKIILVQEIVQQMVDHQNNIHLAIQTAEQIMSTDIKALVLTAIKDTTTKIIIMEMCMMTMEITLGTLVAALQNLVNANNYFRAVLFRMVPKHIKSYSFFK